MKTANLLSIALTALLSSFGSLGAQAAGPKDICYGIRAESAANLSPLAPRQICFESIQISPSEETLSVESQDSLSLQLLAGLQLENLVRTSEDTYSYKALLVLVNQPESHCEDGLKLSLEITGNSDFMGYSEAGTQNLTLIQERTADLCHDTQSSEKFQLTIQP